MKDCGLSLMGYFERFLRERSHESHDNVLILDGVSRIQSQAIELSKRVAVRAILDFVCRDPNTLSQRIARRFRHSGRSDDAKQEIIINRMQVYREKTLPLLDL